VARESGEAAWWQHTWRSAAAIAGGGAVIAVVATTAESLPAGMQVFGLPLGEFFAVIVAPVAIAIAAFVFANRQQALDRRFDVSED
jgi:putative solute:sodium symporter small subunit